MVTLEQYKESIINCHRYKCDGTEEKKQQRRSLLERQMSDESLQEIINNTSVFIEKILKLSEKDYPGYISIPLEEEPKEKNISLNIIGGGYSDSIISDSDGNIYSMRILRMVFGDCFQIEPGKVEYTDDVEEDDFFTLYGEIPEYSLYIQCTKETLDEVRKQFQTETPKEYVKISK